MHLDTMDTIEVKVEREENANYYNVSIGTVVSIPFEDYVAGVVASEVGNSSLEACKAQAVAARTYAMNHKKPISDLSSTAQAFRATRINRAIYPNAMDGAYYTAGQVLTYNNKLINSVYSASNGGRTVSSKERWGNDVPYLIAQDDPWTKSKKNGHGVGMSQNGAANAANQGVSYQDILAFYYPGTKLVSNYNKKHNTVKIPIEKAEYFYNILKEKLEK